METSQPTPATELALAGQGIKPLERKFARALQLEKEYAPGFHDAALRRLARADNLNPATGKPWIPEPKKGLYELAPTLRGIIAHLQHTLAGDAVLPAFASMEMCETAGHIPRTMQKWAQKHGINFQKTNKGVDYDALLRGLNEKLFTPMFSGDTSKISSLGIGGMTSIDAAYEDARLTQERANEQAMLNAEKRGDILFSQDQQAAIGELSATQVLFEQFLGPFKKELLERAKREGFYDTITALLAKHLKKLPAEQPGEASKPGKIAA